MRRSRERERERETERAQQKEVKGKSFFDVGLTAEISWEGVSLE